MLDADLATPNLAVTDEGAVVRSGVTALNFVGAGVAATPGNAGEVVVTVAAPTVRPQAAGTAVIPAPGALNTPVSVNVTFPVGRFTAAPIVTATLNSTGNPQLRSPLSVSAVTAAGFTVYVAQLSGTLAGTTVHWNAVQAG